MTSPHALPFTPAFLKTLHQSWQRLRSIFLGSIDRGRQYRTKLDQARHVCHDVNEEFVEAGIGIEPIFTDLQSIKKPGPNKAVSRDLYQDKSGTQGEPDTWGFATQNENPGALAGATGAGLHTIGIVQTDYPKHGKSAMSLFAKDAHKRVCRMLGYALTLNDPIAWNQTAVILAHRLTSMELASVAFAALSALEPETREAVFEAAQLGVA